MITAGEDRAVRAWDIYSGNNLFSLRNPAGRVFSMTALPNARLAAACSDNIIRVWDLVDQSMLLQLRGHTGSVATLDVNDTWLVSGGFDTTVRLWNLDELDRSIAANLKDTDEKVSKVPPVNTTQPTSLERDR